MQMLVGWRFVSYSVGLKFHEMRILNLSGRFKVNLSKFWA